jgi:serine protease Do
MEGLMANRSLVILAGIFVLPLALISSGSHAGESGPAYLGAVLGDVDGETAARARVEHGALVRDVVLGSPAERGGLESGDVVIRFEDDEVKSAAQLTRLVRETPPGREISVEAIRKGQPKDLRITLGGPFDERESHLHIDVSHAPAIIAVPVPLPLLPPHHAVREVVRDIVADAVLGDHAPRWLGISYRHVEGRVARRYGVDEGILVTHVVEGGPAGRAGMRVGDLIVRIDGEKIEDPGDLEDALDDVDPLGHCDVRVRRDGRTLDLELRLRTDPAI